MPLTKTQKDFLQGFLLVVPKKKSWSVRAPKEDGINTDTTKRFEDYCRREGKVLEEVWQLSALPGTTVTVTGFERRVTTLQNRVKTAPTDPAKAKEAQAEFKIAFEGLKEIKKEVREKVKEAQARAVQIARYQPVYEDALRRVKEGRDRIKELPNVEKEVQKLEKMIREAAVPAGSMDYKTAYDKLDGLQGILQDAEKHSTNFVKEAGDKAFQTARTNAEQALQEFTDVAGLAQPGQVAESRKLIDDQLKSLVGDAQNENKVAAAKGQLEDLAKELKRLTTELQQKKETCRTKYGELDKKVLVELMLWAPASVVEPLQTRVVKGRALYGAQRFEEAIGEFDQIERDMAPTYAKYQEDFNKWKARESMVESAHMAVIAQAMELPNKSVATFASRMETLFRKLQAELPQTHQFLEAAEQIHTEIIAKGPELGKMIKDYEQVETSIEDGKTKVGALDLDLANLAKIVTGLGGSPDELLARCQTARVTWEQAYQSTLEATEVDQAKRTVLATLGTIKDDFNKLINNDGGVFDDNKRDAKKQTNRRAFDELTLETAAAIKSLAVDDPTKANGFNTELNQLVSDAKAEVSDQHVQDLDALKKNVDLAAEASAEEISRRGTALKIELAKLRKTTEELAKKNSDYKAFFDSVLDKLTDCEGLASSTVARVVERGEQVLTELRSEINGLNTELNNKKSPQNFAAVERRVKELLEKITKDKNLKECLPQRQKVLQYRLEKDLQKQLLGMSPEKGLAALNKFDTEHIDAAIREATEAARKRSELTTEGKRLKTEAAKLTEAPKLAEELLARINAAMSPAEGGEAGAKLELGKVDALIRGALDQPETCAQLEKKAYDNAFEQERLQNAWAAARDLFENNEQRGAKVAYDDTDRKTRDEQRYKEIDLHYTKAKKHGDQGNYPLANETLQQAIRAAKDFIQNPHGGRASERNNLQQVYRHWQTAVGNYLQQIEKVKAAIKPEIETANQEAVQQGEEAPYDLTKIETVLDGLYRLFDARMFDQSVHVLTAEDSNLTACRKERENALSYLRSYRQVLDSDPLLAHLRTNTFAPFATRPMQDALADFELNLLRSTY